ncbi:hypothetical protein ACFL6U_11290 [Planctomycetota bacterium]
MTDQWGLLSNQHTTQIGSDLNDITESIPDNDLYMSGQPHDYIPHLEAMDLPPSEYIPYNSQPAETSPQPDLSFIFEQIREGPLIEEQPNLPDIQELNNAASQLQHLLPEDHPNVLRLSIMAQVMNYSLSSLPSDMDRQVSSISSGPNPADTVQTMNLEPGSIDDIIEMANTMPNDMYEGDDLFKTWMH